MAKTEDEIFLEWLKDADLIDVVDPEEYFGLKDTLHFQWYLLDYRLKELGYTASEYFKMLGEQIANGLLKGLDDAVISHRPPVEIKKDIKHEKNPMRLKQLNKELNESYKVYKKKKR